VLPPPTHLASLKSVAGFRQAFPLSQVTDKKFSRKSDKMVSDCLFLDAFYDGSITSDGWTTTRCVKKRWNHRLEKLVAPWQSYKLTKLDPDDSIDDGWKTQRIQT
jgi:hypothetical protein